MSVLIVTFYKFVPIEDCPGLQRSLQRRCHDLNLKGTILLAQEGINATLAGSAATIHELMEWLTSDHRFANLPLKTATALEQPFGHLKVKVKPEIVTLAQPDANPTEQVGTYVSPQDWNQLITDPTVIVIDARNEYEVNIGTFKGAVNPHTESFRQLPEYLHTHLDPHTDQKVAMFCTGGIRCEKATSYLLKQGFSEVYHLQGGILQYLHDIPETESLWQGECFVFDERVTVRHDLKAGSYDLCRACGQPISPADIQSPDYEAGISCPHCYPNLTPEKRAKQVMRTYQHEQKRRRSNE